ncbi:type II toxin-antitoxin system PemK/MazF family toxin [Lactovum odontotermitis]
MVENGIKPKQGDIIWANLNPKKGHEQQGFRPLLVLSNNIVADYTNVVQVAPISTTRRRLPLYLDLPPELETSGAVLLDQIVSIDYTARNAKFGERVPEDFLNQALDIVRRIFTR